MVKRVAACSCGALTVECLADPVRVSICHCLECQKRTGSVFSVNARFLKDNVKATGTESTYDRIGDSGKTVSFRFCPNCGATVYWTLQSFPDVVAVAVGCFGDPGFPAPRFSVYEATCHGWVAIPEHLVDRQA